MINAANVESTRDLISLAVYCLCYFIIQKMHCSEKKFQCSAVVIDPYMLIITVTNHVTQKFKHVSIHLIKVILTCLVFRHKTKNLVQLLLTN